MIDEENNNDPFLKAVKGVKPIKKNNKFNKIVVGKNIIKKKYNEKKIDINKIFNEKNVTTDVKIFHPQNKIEKSKINRKLKKGLVKIDKKVDLHGFSVAEARLRFVETIERCFFSNKRCILFVTGKGISKSNALQKENKLYYGKIRREFTNWVNHKDVRSKILTVEQAGISSGGDGAFFIYLRKNKN